MPSSGGEVIYGFPEEWYDESSALPSLSPATKKSQHDEMENEFTQETESCLGNSYQHRAYRHK